MGARARAWVSVALTIAAALGACAKGAGGVGESEEGGGGEGGEGVGPSVTATQGSTGGASTVASTGGPSSTSASTTTVASSAIASSTGSGGTCDGQGDCQLCQNCALNPPGNCADEWNTCMTNPDCTALNNCLNACPISDQVCIDACFNQYPNGLNDLAAGQDCVFCVECYVDCDGATLGC